jgi:Ni,Fe-hydrogenase maturation factor
MGLPEAVALARELDRLPGRLVVYGIEGENFEAGEGLTEPVQKTVEKLVLDLPQGHRGELMGELAIAEAIGSVPLG